MTEPDPAPAEPEPTSTTNTAQGGATVGIQASVVHNSNVFIAPEAAPPEQVYDTGVRFLESGSPAQARRLIGEAIARGHDTTKARFYFLLALMSRRSDRDLTADEHEQLCRNSTPAPGDVGDEWTMALDVTAALLTRAVDPDTDRAQLLAQLNALPDDQRRAIVHHLDLVLTGVLTDDAWDKIYKAAVDDQSSSNRTGRAWAYFHPDPAPPLAGAPIDDPPTVGAWLRAAITVVVFGAAAGRIVATALDGGEPAPMLALLIGIVACGVAWYAGREWDFRAAQLAADERAHAFNRSLRPPATSYAKRVGERFVHYSIRYAPKDANLDRWLDETAGIRSTLRDEVANLYRSTYTIAQVNWLIRHLVSDLATRWRKGTLHDYRARYRTPPVLKALVVASTATTMTAAFVITAQAATIDPLGSTFAAALAAVGGAAANACTAQVANDLRRHADGKRKHRDALATRTQAYEKWRARLTSTRPSEIEMERWLEADRKVSVGEALATYRLAWRDLIAHAMLQSRTNWYTRAQSQDGPWRYSRYALTLFLMTRDGIREVRTEIDFTKGETALVERNNYRFEAISSVQVTKYRDARTVLALTLINGEPREFRIVDADPDADAATTGGKPAPQPPGPDLDSTGFAHALRVLEGMAAEGRRWIDLRPRASRAANVSGPNLQDRNRSVAEPPDAA